MIETVFEEDSIARARLGLRNVSEQTNRTLKDWVREAAESGAAVMTARAPRHHGLLASAVRVTGPDYRAGGSGGGGSWVAKIDIDPFVAPHYRFVMFGTGIYRNDGGPAAPIHAKGNLPMIYEQFGRTWFMRSVKGQRPQREWFDEGLRTANEVMEAHARYDRPWWQGNSTARP